jgi:mono/diheme cytochrome c family protein
MTGVIELVVVILLAIALAWVATRAWRLRNVPLRILAGVLSVLLTLLLAVMSVVGLVGAYRLYTPHGGPAPNITAQASPDQLTVAARHAGGCTACHSSTGNLPLDGSNENLLGGPIGSLFAPNLTPGGRLKDWTDGEIMRAIREGVDRDGHPLIIMPSEAFHHLSDSDTQQLVAFLRSQPASNHATPPRDLSVMGMVLVGAGLFPTADQPPIAQPQTAPPFGATPQYGQYLVDTTGCATCHGPTLQGKPPGGFGPPAGPNLRALVPTWQEAAFVSFFRSGVDPYGRSIDPALMPWQDIGKAYTDDELRAIYAYIRSLA